MIRGYKQVGLTQAERSLILMWASGQALTYLGHYHDAGLKRYEVMTMNHYRNLAAKIAGKPKPEQLPYRGTRANGFNPEKD